MLLLAAFALIAFPSFSLQLGLARASPLAVNNMRALGPVFVFGVQQFDRNNRSAPLVRYARCGYHRSLNQPP